ncbi:MAG: PepSY domain-containing protein [Pseudomonadales bacterium]
MKQVLRTFQSLLLLSVVCGVVHAQDRPSKPSLPKAERSAISSGLLGSSRSNKAVGVSLRQAMALAREDTGGRVLSSKSFNSGNQGAQIHQIRLLVDGERVVTVVVDAKGRVRRR